MTTTVGTLENSSPEGIITLVGATGQPPEDPTKISVFGIDLTEYYLASQPSSSRYTPMGRFFEGPGVGKMEKLIESVVPPSPTAGRKQKRIRNRKTGSMAVEVPLSERSFRPE